MILVMAVKNKLVFDFGGGDRQEEVSYYAKSISNQESRQLIMNKFYELN